MVVHPFKAAPPCDPAALQAINSTDTTTHATNGSAMAAHRPEVWTKLSRQMHGLPIIAAGVAFLLIYCVAWSVVCGRKHRRDATSRGDAEREHRVVDGGRREVERILRRAGRAEGLLVADVEGGYVVHVEEVW